MPVAKSLVAALTSLLILGTGGGVASAQSRTSAVAQTSGRSTFDGTYKLSATNTDPNDCGTGTDTDMEGNTLVLSGTRATITNQYGTYSGTFNESASKITFPNVTNSAQTLSVTAIMTLSNVSGGKGRIAGTANVSGEDAGGNGYGLLCNLPFTGVSSGTGSSRRGGSSSKKPKPKGTSTTPAQATRAACTAAAVDAPIINPVPGDPLANAENAVQYDPFCVDDWAVQYGTNQGTTGVYLLQYRDGAWHPAGFAFQSPDFSQPPLDPCNKNQLPLALQGLCTQAYGSPSPSTPTPGVAPPCTAAAFNPSVPPDVGATGITRPTCAEGWAVATATGEGVPLALVQVATAKGKWEWVGWVADSGTSPNAGFHDGLLGACSLELVPLATGQIGSGPGSATVACGQQGS